MKARELKSYMGWPPPLAFILYTGMFHCMPFDFYTFKKCQTAVNLDAQFDEVQKRILEIAYFYTEADTLDAALKMLKLLNVNSPMNKK